MENITIDCILNLPPIGVYLSEWVPLCTYSKDNDELIISEEAYNHGIIKEVDNEM